MKSDRIVLGPGKKRQKNAYARWRYERWNGCRNLALTRDGIQMSDSKSAKYNGYDAWKPAPRRRFVFLTVNSQGSCVVVVIRFVV
jgi:hypothetical protein